MAHSIFEVYKRDMSSQISNTTATQNYSDLILKNNFGTPKSESVFQHYISLSKKHNPNDVEHAIIFNTTAIIADSIHEIQNLPDIALEAHDPVNPLIEEEILSYKKILANTLSAYYDFRNEDSIEANNKNEVRGCILINYNPQHNNFPENISEIFNWKNRPLSEYKNLSCHPKNISLDTPEYNQILDELDYVDWLISDDISEATQIDTLDLIYGLCRFQLYRHSLAHNIYPQDFEGIIQLFSCLYFVNLNQKFKMCLRCGEGARRETEIKEVAAV